MRAACALYRTPSPAFGRRVLEAARPRGPQTRAEVQGDRASARPRTSRNIAHASCVEAARTSATGYFIASWTMCVSVYCWKCVTLPSFSRQAWAKGTRNDFPVFLLVPA